MDTSNTKTPSIAKLNSTNFLTWKNDIMSILGYHELTRYLTRDPPRIPQVTIENNEGTAIQKDTTDPTALSRYEEELDRFEIKSFKALSILRLYMDQTEKQEIQSCTTAKQAWTKLLNRHRQQSIARTVMLRRKLYYQTKVTKGGVAAMFNRIDVLVEELKGTIAPVSEGEQMLIMLLSLPDEYEAVTTVLMMKEEKSLTIDAIKNTLLEFEIKRSSTTAIKKEEQEKERAMKAALEKEYKKENKPKCTNCKFIGHTIERCWSKGGGSEKEAPEWWLQQQKDRKKEKGKEMKKKDKEEAKLTRTVEFAMVTVENVMATTVANGDEWIMDSGATKHMTCNLSWISEFTEFKTPILVGSAENDASLKALGSGSVVLKCEGDSGQTNIIRLENVYYIPQLRGNLISSTTIAKKGYTILQKLNTCTVLDAEDDVVMTAALRNGLLCLNGKTVINETLNVALLTRAKPSNELTLWHRRFGHVNERKLLKMISKKSVDGMDIPYNSPMEYCEPCAIEKATKLPFNKKRKHRAKIPLEVIHVDLKQVKLEEYNVEVPKYQLKPLDEATGFQVGYALYNKSEAFDYLREYIAMAETQHDRKIKRIVCDNGGEFVSKEFIKYCKERGIYLDYCAPRTAEQNGIIERSNRTVNEMIRAMLNHAGLSIEYWTYAYHTAIYILNRTLTVTGKESGKTPYELWYNKKPNVSNLRTFGSECVYFLDRHIRDSTEGRGRKGRMLGYAKKGYLIEETDTNRLVVSRHVTFNENSNVELFDQPERKLAEIFDVLVPDSIPDVDDHTEGEQVEVIIPSDASSSDEESSGDEVLTLSESAVSDGEYEDAHSDEGNNALGESEDEIYPPTATESEYNAPTSEFESLEDANDDNSGSEVNEREGEPVEVGSDNDNGGCGDEQFGMELPPIEPPPLRRSTRERKPVQPFWITFRNERDETFLVTANREELESAFVVIMDGESAPVPRSYREAMKSKEWRLWKEAIEKEMKSLKENGTWRLRDVGEVPAGTEVLPCQWVLKIKRNADGTIERYKARLCIFGNKQVKGIHFYETYAPVVRHTSLLTLIALATARKWIMKQFDIETAFIVCPLEKEDGQIFMKQPEGFIEGKDKVCLLVKALYGLKQAPRLFHRSVRNNLRKIGFKQLESDPCVFIYDCNLGTVIIGIHVDDGSLFASNANICDFIEAELRRYWKMKMGDLSYILGNSVARTSTNQIAIYQQSYYDNMLKQFGMENIKPRATPHLFNVKLAPSKNESNPPIPNYREKIGKIMYSATQARPDVLTAVGETARYCNNPDEVHAKAVDQIIHYLAGTKNLALVFDPSVETPTKLYCYVDANWGEDTITRKSVTGYVFMLCGAAISWKSKRQDTVAKSTMEAEYMALSDCVSEAMFLRQLLHELNVKQSEPTVIFEDNDATKGLAEERKTTQRSKHIDIKYHYVRELIEKKEILMKRVDSAENCADVLTKAVTRDKLEYLREKMGLRFIKTSASGSVELV